MNKPILKLENVSYRYKDAAKDDYVIKDLSFDFEPGKIYSIVGPSGSGKTTLLGLLCGLERCTEGNIFYDDTNLRKIDLDRYRSNHVGIVFQSYNLLPHLTASENIIIMAMDLSKTKIKNKKEKAIELLNLVGLKDSHANQRVLKMSGGEQQRVAIARSLSYDSKIIIADEPTGNLDPKNEQEIINLFRDLAVNHNKCVIIVTHSDKVSEQADVVFRLKPLNK